MGFFADMALKVFVYNSLPDFGSGFLFYGNFGFTRFINKFFAFGIPIGNEASSWLMVFAILTIFVWWFFYSKNRSYYSGFVFLIILGALANLASRIIWGGVVDYIVIPFGGVINVADIMIFLGAVFMLSERTKILD